MKPTEEVAMSGYDLINRTKLGEAITKYFPTELLTRIVLDIRVDEVKVLAEYNMPINLADCEGWEELMKRMQEQGCKLVCDYATTTPTPKSGDKGKVEVSICKGSSVMVTRMEDLLEGLKAFLDQSQS